MIKKILSAAVFFSFAALLHAQVTYTSANFGNAGDSLFYSKVFLDSNNAYNFSQAGANTTWNYSALTPGVQFMFYFLNPAAAGYRQTFITQCIAGGGTAITCNTQFTNLTNVAFLSPDSIRVGNFTFDNIVAHDDKTAGSLATNIIGMSARVNGAAAKFAFPYIQPDMVYKFPLAYTNTDSSRSSYNIDLTSRGVNFVEHIHNFRKNRVESWGSITTPYTTYSSTVRLRSTILHTDTVFYNFTTIPIPPFTTVEYSWFAPAFKAPVFTVSGNITGNQERYKTVTYLDTVVCLAPRALAHFNPAVPFINPGTGTVRVNFANTTLNANTYSWNFGDTASGAQNVSSVRNPFHIYSAPGTYSVTLIACNTICNPEKCDTLHLNVKVFDSTQVRAAFVAQPNIICQNDSVHFINNSRNATSYLWKFGDGTTSTTANPVHQYTQPGNDTVWLYAVNNNGTDSASRIIRVQALPVPVIHNTGPLTFCNGDSVTLYATGGNIYRWSNGRVGASITVKVSGSYSVTAANTCGSVSAGPVVVTVNTPVDTITAIGNTTFCSGDSVLLQANTVPGGTYKWRRNGQIIIGATQSTFYAKVSGNYLVNVTALGCVGVSNVITVTSTPAPNAAITAPNGTAICSGDSVLLIAALANNSTYQWQLNGVDINGAATRNYNAAAAGDYTVVVTRGGCSKVSNIITVTSSVPPAPTLIYAGNGSICQGDSLLISTANATGYSYQWLRNGISINGATSQYYYASTGGNYRVRVTSLGCTGTSSPLTVIVHAKPNADAGTDQSLTGCSFSSVSIGGNPTASGGTSPYSYLWSPLSGLSSATAANPSVSQIGSTTVYNVVVTDSNGCSASDSVTITVTGSALSVTISAVGSLSWCEGADDSVTLTAVPGSPGTYIYNWTPSTGLSNTNSVSTVAKPVSAGAYNYTLLITDVSGCQASANTTIQVYATASASIVAHDTTTVCSGDSVHLSAAPGALYTYQWLMDGTSISGATDIDFAAGDAGIYEAQVTAPGGCTAISNPVSVTVNPSPTASISAVSSLNFCAGSNALLSAFIGSGYVYQWNENGFDINGANSSVYSAQDSGTYYARVTLNGCTRISNSLTTSVNPVPSDSITLNGSPEFCSGGSVILSASSGSGSTYQWYQNGTMMSGATSSQLNVSASGVYNVIVTANGCSSTSLGVQVTVNPYPVASISPGGNLSFCFGDSVILSASTGTGYSYQWFLDGTAINGATDLNLTVSNDGSYSVDVSRNGCTTSSTADTVTVNFYPDGNIVPQGNVSICPGEGTALSAFTGYSYQWLFNGNNIPGADSTTYFVTQPGDYSLVETRAGCSITSNTVTVGFYSPPTISQSSNILSSSSGVSYQWYQNSVLVPGATQQTYSPSSAGDYTVEVTDSHGCTQTSDVYHFTPNAILNVDEHSAIAVYPNPAHESVTVSVAAAYEIDASVSLLDITGREIKQVYNGKIASGNSSYYVSLSELSAGFYLLRFYDGERTTVRRVVKE